MKKYLLLIISMVCAVTGAWADGTVISQIEYSGGYYVRVDITNDPECETVTGDDIIKGNWGHNTEHLYNKVEINGEISQTGLNVIDGLLAAGTMYYPKNKHLDLSGASINGTLTSLPSSSGEYSGYFTTCVLPNGTTMPATIAGNYDYVYSGCESDGIIRIYVKTGTTSVPQLTEAQISAASSIEVSGTGKNAFIEALSDAAKDKLAFDGSAIIATTSTNNLQVQLETYLTSKNIISSTATDEQKAAALTQMTSLTVTGPFTSADVTYLANMTNLKTLDLTGANFGTGVTKASIAAAVPNTTTVLYAPAYTISDCTVTIDMGKAMGDDLATILAQAKTDLGSTNICTLIVTGEISDTELAALNGSDLASATRIDLSGATIASGSSINNITLPATLEQLVLPKGMGTAKLPDALRSKFAGASNLMYAYSPTSNTQTATAQHVADLVWVNKPGGLDKAIINEAKLRTAVYVKVESAVALNADDVDLATNNKQTGENTYENVSLNNISTDATNYAWQYIDMSGANLQNDVIVSYKAPQTTNSYRLILPDGWGPNRMSIIPSLEASNYGSGLAAVYSYTAQGFLQILEINDTQYKSGALADNRIVRDGTKAVRVVSGEYDGKTYGSFGEYNNGSQNHLLEAINAASPSIEAITITNTRCVQSSISIDNDNLIYIQIEGIHNANNFSEGPALNVDGCKNLGTLNLINSVFASVDASVPALAASGDDPATTGLTAVNMSGTTVVGTTDLSTSPITNIGFVTNSDTWFKNDLNLSKTALTTFTTTAKVGTTTDNTGNIILNENELTNVSLNQVQFQNTTSKIYVRKSADSNSGDYETLIESLDGTETIIVPEKFDKANRIVPYKAASVKEEKYVAPPYVFSATDMRLHEAETTGTNPDKYVYWYTGDMQEKKVLTLTTTEGGQLTSLLASDKANVTSSTELIKVKITGPLASNDLTALASLNTQILDLSEATLQKESSGTYTNDVTIFEGKNVNQHVKFLLLPAGMTRDDVVENNVTKEGIVNATSLAGFTGLYSAISLTDYNPNNAFDFTSYNKVAGTLQPAVIAAGRGTLNGSQMIRGEEGNTRTAYYPTMSGNYNRSATISGLINAYDLSYSTKLDADGHLKFNKRYADESLDADDRTNVGTETKIQGAFSGSNGPRTLDLKAAEITGPEYINDICISYLVPTNYLKYLIIPQNTSVKETPSYFIQHNLVKEICIPSNIEVIRTHFAPSLDHIWTNAASGDITGTKYDNGAFSAKSEEDKPTEANYGYTDFTFSGLMPYGTYTFSSNLKMIESHAFANTQPHVKDVYVLATTAPECHVDAFCTAMYVGNSGFSPNVTGGVITRDSYVNGTNWITMLHYPRQCISPEVQRYTDPTRSYNIASNEIDGKGGVLYYPSYGEFLAAYAQGTTGYLWNAFDRTYEFGMLKNSLSIENTGWTLANQRSANSKFLENPDLKADNKNTKWTCTSFYDVTAGGTETQPTNLAHYYNVRWDERNLYDGGSTGIQLYPQAESANDIDGDGNITAKDYRGWHQFVLNAYAANTDIPVVPSRSYVTDSDWWTICLPYDLTYNETMLFFGTANDDGTVASDKVPYVCLLSNVVRDHVNNHITLNFSSNLMNHKASKSENGIWSIDANNAPNHNIARDINHGGTADIVIHAGVPYLIKPVFPANAKRQFDIYGPTGVVDAALSSGRITATDTQYPGLYDKLHAAQDIAGSTFLSMLQDNLYTVPALLPKDTYDSSKEAYVDDTEYTYLDKTYYRSNAYDYTFVGSFMKNVIPPYCYFLGVKGGKAAFIYADYLDLDGNDPVKAAKKYKYMNTMMWNNNSGVICPNMFASTSDKHFYRLAHTGGHDGEIEVASGSGENMKPARWEIFTTTNNTMNNMLPKDDFSSKSPAPAMLFGFDLPQGTTGIDNNMTTSISFEDENVYSLNGRFVGTTLEGLAKGVYIRNGKKIVVK